MARIALYSHDTLGLGHLRRCLRLGHHIERHFGAVDGLLVTGSPWHQLFPVPRGFAVRAIPPVVKSGAGAYVSRDGSDVADTLALRRHRITTELRRFSPDLFVVDNVPCGLRGEVVPALRTVRAAGGRNVLALRDVLDDVDVIRAEWEEAGAIEAVTELFDEVWMFGDAADAETLIANGPLAGVAERVHACGRIGRTATVAAATGDRYERPIVLVTGGGGRDAEPLLTTYLQAATSLRPPVTSHLILGPDYPSPVRRGAHAAARSDLEVFDFVPDMPRRFAGSSVIVGMAGYNTVCEILASGRPAVLVPRVSPRQEQLLRARRWQREGRARLIEPQDLTPTALRRAVEELLEHPGHPTMLPTGGVVAAGRAAALLGASLGAAS